MQMRWKCNLSQMYPKTRMRRKSFYQPCLLMMRLTTSPKMKLVRKRIVIFDYSVMYISKLNMNKTWNDVGPKVPVNISCDSCGRKFKSWADLSKHSKALHFKDDFNVIVVM